MHKLTELRRSGLTLTEAFFALLRLSAIDRMINVWRDLYRAGYGKNDYLDFTHDSWVVLPVAQQIKYASEYQNWYAERLGERVERSFDGIVFRLIPPGKYKMGSPQWERMHQANEGYKTVLIRNFFWCGKYEVTQKEWFKVMGNNPSYFVGKKRPVEQVSWGDVSEFCSKMNFDLLHEKQWEYACRGGTTAAYSFGSDPNLLEDYAYYWDNSRGQRRETHPVGEKLPNSWGLYDMHGNVWEWCKNLYNKNSSYCAYRGGCFISSSNECRSAYHDGDDFRGRFSNLGFRVCFN